MHKRYIFSKEHGIGSCSNSLVIFKSIYTIYKKKLRKKNKAKSMNRVTLI